MNTSKSMIRIQSQRDLIPDPSVLWSSGAAWHGVIAEAYRFAAVETVAFQTVDHALVLHLSPPALIELKVDYRRDTRTRVPGDISIFPARAVRQIRSAEPHEILVLTFSQQVLAHSGFELRDPTPFDLPPCAYKRDAQIEHICRAIKAEAESNYVSGSLYGESLALAMGSHLLRHRSADDPCSGRRGGIAPQALRRVIDYIESNLDSPLRMASLAELTGLSQFRFAHNFKSAVGLPPYQYVLHRRLERAKEKLRSTNLSILEIAYAVGCQGCSPFNSLFRRELGITPSAYRASFR